MTNLIKSESGSQIEIAQFRTPARQFYGREIELKSELNNSEIELIDAINYLPINQISRNELLELVFTIVANNLRAISSKMLADDMVLLTNDLINELNSDFKLLTIKEVELIIKNGIRKKYDTDQNRTIGLSVVNFNYWAQCYLTRKWKLNCDIENKLKREADEPEKITKESILAILRNDYISHRKAYKKIPAKERIEWDKYWMQNGAMVSANYLTEKLISFNLIDQEEIKTEYQKLTGQGKKLPFAMHESRRIICCRLALKLRDEKLNQL